MDEVFSLFFFMISSPLSVIYFFFNNLYDIINTFRDLVELFVTKKIFLPMPRSLSKTPGTPSMRESPFQMTPSQSKMNTSVFSINLAPSAPPFIFTGALVTKVLAAPARRLKAEDSSEGFLLRRDLEILPRVSAFTVEQIISVTVKKITSCISYFFQL